MYNNKNNVPFASRRELVISIAFACFNITIFGLFCEFTSINKAVLAFCVVLIYLIEVSILGLLRQKQQSTEPNAGMHAILAESSSIVLKNTNQPIATFDEQGTVLWCNEAMLGILRLEDNPIGMSIENVFGTALSADKLTSSTATIKNRLYSIESFILSSGTSPIYMLSLIDITALSEMEKKYNEEQLSEIKALLTESSVLYAVYNIHSIQNLNK